jgi:sec-independent protein translocase protein TatC
MFDELKPHLKELQKRLIYSIVSVFVMFVIAFGFWELILDWMLVPLKSSLPEGSNVVFLKVGEAFFTALKVSFFASLILSLPIIFYQLWMFVAPGLYDSEKKLVLPFVISATGMFVAGALFAYYIVFPFGFAYLINFGSQLFTAMPSIGEYVGFFSKLMVGFGISFELPVLTFFLASLGLLTDESLKSFFKFAIIIIFIVAALLTPPDILSQLLMAGPLIILYGVSILIARVINPEKRDD